MANFRISDLTSYSNPDPVNDVIEIVDNTNNANKKISRNNLLGITSTPVGINDIQTLTQKTLTAPTISSPILSGTLTGTYTLAGTPTFPSSVVTLTGSQTLTNKVLTSPTINAPTITNASITQDTVTGFTSANNGTVYGIAVSSAAFTTNNIVPNNSLSNTGTFGSAWAWVSWVGTVVGWSSTTTAQKYFAQIGKTVFFNIHYAGTSNSVTTSFTLPVPTVSNTHVVLTDGVLGLTQDNGSVLATGRWEIDNSAGTPVITCFSTQGGGAWTASGTKVVRLQGFYEAA